MLFYWVHFICLVNHFEHIKWGEGISYLEIKVFVLNTKEKNKEEAKV